MPSIILRWKLPMVPTRLKVAFREAVFAKALDLVEAELGEVARVAVRQHAVDHLALETADGADALEGGHPGSRIRQSPRSGGSRARRSRARSRSPACRRSSCAGNCRWCRRA